MVESRWFGLGWRHDGRGPGARLLLSWKWSEDEKSEWERKTFYQSAESERARQHMVWGVDLG